MRKYGRSVKAALVNSLTIGYLRPTNIFSYCRFGVWAGEIFFWGAAPLAPPPPPLVAALL